MSAVTARSAIRRGPRRQLDGGRRDRARVPVLTGCWVGRAMTDTVMDLAGVVLAAAGSATRTAPPG